MKNTNGLTHISLSTQSQKKLNFTYGSIRYGHTIFFIFNTQIVIIMRLSSTFGCPKKTKLTPNLGLHMSNFTHKIRLLI